MKTIKSSKEIDLIFKNGEKKYLPFLTYVIFYDINQKIDGNIAFIAGKKQGNAVWRNKNKRRLRELYKSININNKYKVLFIANKCTIKIKFDEELQKLKDEFKKYENNF